MKAVLPLFFTGLLGLGAAAASAQPGDPAGNQTIPEKDLSRPDASRPGGTQGGSVVDDHEKKLSDKLDASGGWLGSGYEPDRSSDRSNSVLGSAWLGFDASQPSQPSLAMRKLSCGSAIRQQREAYATAEAATIRRSNRLVIVIVVNWRSL